MFGGGLWAVPGGKIEDEPSGDQASQRVGSNEPS
jgi:hypothetical protein